VLTERQKVDARLDPDLRDFIDRAIVPILVKKYLAGIAAENDLADEPRLAQYSPFRGTWAW
jgi:hypothetical protein